MRKSSWITWCILKPMKMSLQQTHRGKGDVRMEVRIGVVWPQAQECQESHQKLNETGNSFSTYSSQRETVPTEVQTF